MTPALRADTLKLVDRALRDAAQRIERGPGEDEHEATALWATLDHLVRAVDALRTVVEQDAAK